MPAPTDLLEQFLNTKTEDELFRFARRFGPLGVFERKGVVHASPADLEHVHGSHFESLNAWRQTRDTFEDMLDMAALAQETKGIAKLRDYGLSPPKTWRTANPRERRVWGPWLLPGLLEEFVRDCRLRPTVRFWPTQQLVFVDAIGFMGFGLSLCGALTVQTIAASLGRGFTYCSSCGALYTPTRRPSAGRRHYCPACRAAGAPTRDAKVDMAARRRTEGRKRARSHK